MPSPLSRPVRESCISATGFGYLQVEVMVESDSVGRKDPVGSDCGVVHCRLAGGPDMPLLLPLVARVALQALALGVQNPVQLLD